MKTPINMLEDIKAEVIENTCLLEVIYRNSNENEETDCAIACLIRSLHKTKERITEYVEQLDNKNKSNVSVAPEQNNATNKWSARRVD